MIWKVEYALLGGHVHCALFTASGPNRTFARCGDFVVRQEEFASLRQAFSGAQFIDTHPQREELTTQGSQRTSS